MIFGCLVGGKTYAIRKYFLILAIASGAIMFVYKPDQILSKDSIVGLALVGVSLLMNGCMAGAQEKMRAVSRPTPLNLMLFLNTYGSILAIVGVIGSGEVKDFIEFCSTHPEILVQLGLIFSVGGLGQYFVCMIVTSFGVVPCSIVLMLRRFFNILFSILYFGHSLSIRQWLATALIFASLMADLVVGLKFEKGDKNQRECKANVDKNGKEMKINIGTTNIQLESDSEDNKMTLI